MDSHSKLERNRIEEECVDRELVEENSNSYQSLISGLAQVQEELEYLRDLFVRRLNDDKQKKEVIQKLTEGATYAFIEPFLYDIILLLDRLEKNDDDFVVSVREELFEIVNRRGVELIRTTGIFDPKIHKAIKVEVNPEIDATYVLDVVRNGYSFSGKVIRPSEVIVIKPVSN